MLRPSLAPTPVRIGTTVTPSEFTAVKPKLVLPGATKDALKALPEFRYAKN